MRNLSGIIVLLTATMLPNVRAESLPVVPTGTEPAVIVLHDPDGVQLTIGPDNGTGLRVEIDGGAFLRNSIRLSATEAQDFVAGLRNREYSLQRSPGAGGLEFLTVDVGGGECTISVQSTRAGTMAIGTFRCEAQSLPSVADRVASLISAAREP